MSDETSAIWSRRAVTAALTGGVASAAAGLMLAPVQRDRPASVALDTPAIRRSVRLLAVRGRELADADDGLVEVAVQAPKMPGHARVAAAHRAQRPPIQRYAGAPRIVVVIDDVGPSIARARQAIALPAPVTLAMLPYAQGVADLAQAASARGHELLVHVPMQPSYGANPGPQALLLDQTPEERQRLLQWNLAQFSGYVGINNHMGSQFTEDSAALRPVIETVRAANLLFLDSRTTVHTAGCTLASELAVPFAERDVFLDNHRNADYLALQLAQVEAIARRRGLAVAIGHPHEVTLAALAAWLPRLDARGFALTSVRAVAQRA